MFIHKNGRRMIRSNERQTDNVISREFHPNFHMNIVHVINPKLANTCSSVEDSPHPTEWYSRGSGMDSFSVHSLMDPVRPSQIFRRSTNSGYCLVPVVTLPLISLVKRAQFEATWAHYMRGEEQAGNCDWKPGAVQNRVKPHYDILGQFWSPSLN